MEQKLKKLIDNKQIFEHSIILNPYDNFFIVVSKNFKIFNSFTLINGIKKYSFLGVVNDNFMKKYNLKKG